MDILYAGNVTGTSHYEGWDELNKFMEVGHRVGLKREATNPYDSRATGVFYEGRQIGWVPKSCNRKIAEALDNNIALEARITYLNRKGNYEDRLAIAIYAVDQAEKLKAESLKNKQEYDARLIAARNKVNKLKEQDMAYDQGKALSKPQVAVHRNKSSATTAAFMEAGRIANNQVAKLASKHLPMMLRGYADSAAGRLIIANIADFAIREMRPNDEKLHQLTKAMMVQSYQALYAELDIEKIIDDLLSESGIKRALDKIVDDAGAQ